MKCISATVFAGLLTVTTALPAQAADFNGLHFGIGGGINDTNLKLRFDEGGRVKAGNSDGELIFFAGFDHTFNERLVLGLDAEWALRGDAQIEELESEGLNFDFFDGSWSLGVRGGVLLTESVLAYGKVGFITTEIGGKDFSGVRFGGGLEANLFWRLALRGEVLHARFGGERLDPFDVRATPDTTQVRAGLLVRF